jgi:hypothetical protein
MSQRIHFNDDLFFLTKSMRTVKDGLSLEIDGPLFMENVVMNLDFYGECIEDLVRSLDDNRKLIDWMEYLRSLYLAERQYLDILDAALDPDASYAPSLEKDRGRLEAARSAHRKALADMRSRLSLKGEEDGPQEDVVSKDELDELLKGTDGA